MNPKLEVFKFALQNNKVMHAPCFHTFQTPNLGDKSSAVFLDIFTNFIKKIDGDKYHTKGTKGFTAYDTKKTEKVEPNITCASEEFLIKGIVEGGKFGRDRYLSDVERKAEKQFINNSKIVTDKFYFLIHIPVDSKYGILFIQSYGSDNITNAFIDFLTNFFTNETKGYTKPKFEKFYPKGLIEEFEKNCVMKSFKFTETTVDKGYSSSTQFEKTNQITIKVEITSKNDIDKKSFKNFLDKYIDTEFLIGGEKKKLKSFSDIKGVAKNVKNGQRSNPFTLSDNFDIKPLILLKNIDNIVIGNTINFTHLESYCLSILEQVKKEIYPSSHVKEI